jgi:hypothetical protein
MAQQPRNRGGDPDDAHIISVTDGLPQDEPGLVCRRSACVKDALEHHTFALHSLDDLSDPSLGWAAMWAPHLLLEIAHAMTRRLSFARACP